MIADCVPIECQIACRTVTFMKNTRSGQNSNANLLMNINLSLKLILAKYYLTHMMFHTESVGSIIY